MFRKRIILNTPCVMRKDYHPDPSGGQSFNINTAGWLSSDVSLLIAAQSQQIQDNIMKRLTIFKAQSNVGLTDAQILKMLVPRYCQSYAERSSFFEYLRQTDPKLFNEMQDVSDKKVVEENKVEDQSS